MLSQLRLIPTLLLMNVRAQMEYRGAFWIDRIAQIITYSSSFAVLWIIVAQFDTLAGWGWADLALLYSFHMLSYSIGACMSFTQMRDLEEHVRLGTFDTIITRPMSPWVYLVFARFNIGYASHVILAVSLMTWALLTIDVEWSIGWVVYFILSMLSAAMVSRWAGRMINIHPSLLPAFKGLDPHRRALEAGVRIHGCSVHFVTPAMDDGPIIAQAAVPVRTDDDEKRLAARVLTAEHRLYPLALGLLAEGKVRMEAGRTVFQSGGLPERTAESSLVAPEFASEAKSIEDLARFTP